MFRFGRPVLLAPGAEYIPVPGKRNSVSFHSNTYTIALLPLSREKNGLLFDFGNQSADTVKGQASVIISPNELMR